MSIRWTNSQPNSGIVLWALCQPQPVFTRSEHSFKVENSSNNSVREEVMSATVSVVPAGGLELLQPVDGASGPSVSFGRIGDIGPGQITRPISTTVQKRPATYSQREDICTTIAFRAVVLPNHVVPGGNGATIHTFNIPVVVM